MIEGISLARVFWGVVWLGSLVGLAFSWLGLLGDRHWALDLLSHFRWQYLLAAALVLLMAVGRRAWVMAGAGLATVALNVWLIFGFVAESGVPDETDPGLKVMCLNLFVGNEDHDSVIAEVRSVDPDVVIFEEVSRQWGLGLKPLANTHPFHQIEPDGVSGLAVFSKVPIEKIQTVRLGLSGFPILEATVIVGGRELLIIGAHPLPPMASKNYAGWADHLAKLGERVTESDIPAVLVGDLNATPWCHGMRELLWGSGLGFRLADSAAPWYAAYPTWAVGSPMSIHIDHILCTPELVLDQYQVGNDVGSDHRPVVARVRWVK